jgi:hypothetical protein
MLPVSINGNSGGEGVFGMSEPLGEDLNGFFSNFSSLVFRLVGVEG